MTQYTLFTDLDSIGSALNGKTYKTRDEMRDAVREIWQNADFSITEGIFEVEEEEDAVATFGG